MDLHVCNDEAKFSITYNNIEQAQERENLIEHNVKMYLVIICHLYLLKYIVERQSMLIMLTATSLTLVFDSDTGFF